MPFSTEYLNPQLIEQHLSVEYNNDGQKVTPSINLDKYLGNVDGKLQWGGSGFYSTARNTSLSGHILRTELKQGNKWVPATVDLSSHFHVSNGKWKYSDADLQMVESPLTGRSDGSPPPPYTRSSTSFREWRKSQSFSKSVSHASSFFQYKVNHEKLSLHGSVLTYASSEIQLDDYIGIINGRLIWGSRGFYGVCGGRVSLNTYTLIVEFENQKLELDLTRYLQFHGEKMTLKVTGPNPELSRLLSEARWLKFKLISEPDVSEASIQSSAFQAAIQGLEETSREVVAEMTHELVEIGSKEILESVTDQVKTDMTRTVADKISEEVEKTLEKQIELAFAMAKKTVTETCKVMVRQAAEQVTVTKKDTVIGPMSETIAEQCRKTIATTIEEATESARTDFQERVTVLLENEMVWASVRRSQTRAAILEMMMEAEGGDMHLFGGHHTGNGKIKEIEQGGMQLSSGHRTISRTSSSTKSQEIRQTSGLQMESS
ncbi:hypothetical protein VKT23_008526 [Stygiomarasmius scandens]|uniref:Cyanovirin-N domain-containing protein n=1 Tax=Marasmiellus scandens TaxID=2682957 RepID=A0ABR1JGN2_9AGAR